MMIKFLFLVIAIKLMLYNSDATKRNRWTTDFSYKGHSLRDFHLGRSRYYNLKPVWSNPIPHGYRGYKTSWRRNYPYKPVHYSCPLKPAKYSNLNNFSNGDVKIERATVGNSTSFSCNENFTLCGANTITCTTTGRWDRTVPACLSDKLKNKNYLFTKYGNAAYVFMRHSLNFIKAEAFCKRLKGNLVSINSREEQDFIACGAYQMDKYNLYRSNRYIGLTKKNERWEWTNGDMVTVEFWEDKTGNDCGSIALLNKYNWSSVRVNCTDPLPFICEIH